MSAVCDPIRADELASLFAGCCEGAQTRVALAVSGGSDSTALAVLFADWLRRQGADPAAHTVLTVDHRLRPESAAEAETVARLAAGLGFRHATLVWEGPRPRSGLQAAAREARYRLLAGHAQAHGIGVLLTAHTLDDQAETLLMRLARGSGLDGLAGIAPQLQLGALRVVRPLLGIAKARLRATLEQRAISWIEDPSNEQPAFERTRLRAARPRLDALGLTPAMLASSVARLQQARAALDGIVDDLCAAPPQGLVAVDPCGGLTLDRQRLSQAPEELALRVLARCILAAGGSPEPVPLAKLEALGDGLRRYISGRPASWTLARALVEATPELVRIEREPGRAPLPRQLLARGERTIWDGRFVVSAGAGLEGSLEVRALGPDGLAEARRQGWPGKRSRALQLAPSLWRGEALVAAPALELWASPGLQASISCAFVGLRRNPSFGAAAPELGWC